MNHYTPEYKDAVHKIAKLYDNGVISFNTFSLAVEDIHHVMDVSIDVIKADISVLWGAWEEHEVLG